ncbi:MAG: PQQ-binding-like beta-propeller repeat protein [Myxococcaceae bacterium]
MLKFKLGTRWRGERVGDDGPTDALGLDLSGVDLLAGAGDEPLALTVPALVETVWGLKQGERLGEVSLTEAQLELCLVRQGQDVELLVASLGKPVKLSRPPVKVGLDELCEAAARCGRQLSKHLSESAPSFKPTQKLEQMNKRLPALESGGAAELKPVDPGAWAFERFGAQGGVKLKLFDPDGRMVAFHRKSAAMLTALLVPGELSVPTSSGEFKPKGLPFLELYELSKKAAASGGEEVELPGGARAKARAIFEAGLDLCVAVSARNPALARSSHVEALSQRCTEGLSQLKTDVPQLKANTERPKEKRAPQAPALGVTGELRRVKLEQKWERSTEVDEPTELSWISTGPVVQAPHAAWAFDAKGKSLWRRVSPQGVSVGPKGEVLLAGSGRVTAFQGGATEAKWFRGHDGGTVGPWLDVSGSLWITPFEARGLLAYNSATGYERWRLEPGRGQKSWRTLTKSWLLWATDSGSLFGLDVDDGQVRFRIRASMPFAAAPLVWGKRVVALVARGDRSAIFGAETTGNPARPPGSISWTREMLITRPAAPLLFKNRLWITGASEGRCALLALDRFGELVLERHVPLEAGKAALVQCGDGVLAYDSRGAATLVSPSGEIEWVIGAAGEPLGWPIAPVVGKEMVLLAGEVVRAVETKSGRVLGELKAGPGLVGLRGDRRLNFYTLDDAGVLKAHAIRSALSVV